MFDLLFKKSQLVLNVVHLGVVNHILDLSNLGSDVLHLPALHLLDLLELSPHLLQVVVELIRVDVSVLVHHSRLRDCLLFGAVSAPELIEDGNLLTLELALIFLLLFVARGGTRA